MAAKALLRKLDPDTLVPGIGQGQRTLDSALSALHRVAIPRVVDGLEIAFQSFRRSNHQ